MSIPNANRPGSQLTPAGRLPAHWQYAKLGDVAEMFLNGGTPSRTVDEYWDGDIPWITGADIIDNRIDNIRRYITQAGVKNSATNVINKGELLVVTRTGVGKIAVAPCNIAVSQDITGVYLDKTRADVLFMLYLICQNFSYFKNCNQGTSINGITRDDLTAFTFSLPPLCEQRKIAAVLSAWDEAAELTRKLITACRKRKKGLMQRLLTQRKSSEQGNWQYVKLEDVATDFCNGGTPSRQVEEYWNGNIPWITGADVVDYRIDNIRRYITPEAVQNSATNIIRKDELLIVTRTGVGKIAVAPFDIAISQDLTGVYLDKTRADVLFLLYFISHNVSHLQNYNQGTSINGVTRADLSSFPILLPPLSEQRNIAAILSLADEEIRLLEKELQHLQKQKKGLMQVLLTGKIRV